MERERRNYEERKMERDMQGRKEGLDQSPRSGGARESQGAVQVSAPQY